MLLHLSSHLFTFFDKFKTGALILNKPKCIMALLQNSLKVTIFGKLYLLM